MMIDSVPGLLAVLRKHCLLEPEQLAGAEQLAQRHTDPRLLAKELLQRGWLTPFQINQVFLGRGAELVLGSYLLLQRIGEGSMGQVFKARHQKHGRIVALKAIRKDRLAQPNALKRFLREIKAAARLSHPNIVLAYDADETTRPPFFVMEFIEGADLSKLVKQNGPLPVWQACDYIRQAAQGLQHAFECGLVHRDVKPSNLIVTTTVAEPSKTAPPHDPDGGGRCLVAVVKLLDLGLARLQDADDGGSRLTQLQTILGTPDYISPEQARDSHAADIRSDLYCLGCTFYFLLTARVPFPGESRVDKILKQCQEEPEPVEQVRRGVLADERASLPGYGPDSPVEDEVPPAVAALVRKLMAKRPGDRYQSPDEVARVLTDLIPKGIRLAIPAEAFVPSAPPPREINLWAALTSRQGIALLAAVGAVFLALVLLLILALLSAGPGAGRARAEGPAATESGQRRPCRGS
jgi:eukaryotic-like serine/threonine-protein kinase